MAAAVCDGLDGHVARPVLTIWLSGAIGRVSWLGGRGREPKGPGNEALNKGLSRAHLVSLKGNRAKLSRAASNGAFCESFVWGQQPSRCCTRCFFDLRVPVSVWFATACGWPARNVRGTCEEDLEGPTPSPSQLL